MMNLFLITSERRVIIINFTQFQFTKFFFIVQFFKQIELLNKQVFTRINSSSSYNKYFSS